VQLARRLQYKILIIKDLSVKIQILKGKAPNRDGSGLLYFYADLSLANWG